MALNSCGAFGFEAFAGVSQKIAVQFAGGSDVCLSGCSSIMEYAGIMAVPADSKMCLCTCIDVAPFK